MGLRQNLVNALQKRRRLETGLIQRNRDPLCSYGGVVQVLDQRISHFAGGFVNRSRLRDCVIDECIALDKEIPRATSLKCLNTEVVGLL